MPKTRIVSESDAEELREFLRQTSAVGPFARIGDQNVKVDDIREFAGPRDSATFTLSDGSTVQHDEFKQGSVGDLIFDAFVLLKRRDIERQTLLPDWPNVLLRVSSGDTLERVNTANEVLQTYGTGFNTDGQTLGAMDVPADLVAYEDSSADFTSFQYGDGTQRGSASNGVTDPDEAALAIGDDGKIYTALLNGNGNLELRRRNKDLSVADDIVTDSDGVSFNIPRIGLAVDTAAGFALAAGNEDNMLRIDLSDGTASSYSNFGNNSNDTWQSYADAGNNRWIMSTQGEVYELPVNDLTASETLLRDFSGDLGGSFNTRPLIDFDAERQLCLFQETGDEETFKADLQDGSVEFLGGFGDTVAGVLDLSLV